MTRRTMERNALSHIDAFKASTDYSLDTCYGRYSKAKANAWDYCKELCYRLGWWGLKVITHNVNIFTAGFLFTDEQTGVIRFMYITPSYDVSVDYLG